LVSLDKATTGIRYNNG